GDAGDVQRRRVRAAVARLPVPRALRVRALLPGRRPGRSGDPARAAAHLRRDAFRRDGTDPAFGADRGVAAHLAGLPPSLWPAQVDDDLTPQPALDGDLDVDVAIVGAGYTGLWTAYYLTEADPSLRIVVVEANIAGYGASGRNGGWCSALLP